MDRATFEFESWGRRCAIVLRFKGYVHDESCDWDLPVFELAAMEDVDGDWQAFKPFLEMVHPWEKLEDHCLTSCDCMSILDHGDGSLGIWRSKDPEGVSILWGKISRKEFFGLLGSLVPPSLLEPSK